MILDVRRMRNGSWCDVNRVIDIEITDILEFHLYNLLLIHMNCHDIVPKLFVTLIF
jgi:hypothetical protein